MQWQKHRSQMVRTTVDNIRNIESNYGVTKQGLVKIQNQLEQLAAADANWFMENEFPAPDQSSTDSSVVYRISEDAEDHRFALYVQSARAPTNAPPHNHDTWAVIAGISGEELNRFYRRVDSGVEEVGSHVVQLGTSVALLPEDLHSIHIKDENAVINFHMYGLGLEYLTEREYYDSSSGKWRLFRSRDNIIDARYVVQ